MFTFTSSIINLFGSIQSFYESDSELSCTLSTDKLPTIEGVLSLLSFFPSTDKPRIIISDQADDKVRITGLSLWQDDIIIILGDAGINFRGGWIDLQNKNYISSLPIDHPRGVHLLESMKMELSDYAARHNYVVVDEILDYGSGTTLTRPGLKEIFLLMKNYSIDIVLTTEETQLAANIDDRIALREWFSANNTIVKCTRDNKKS